MDEERIVKIVHGHYPSVEAIYLFGSYAQGDQWPQSDVDIALLLPPADARDERVMAISPCRMELADALGKELDLVNLRLVSTVFQNEIIHSGRRFFTAGEEAALSFEMKVLSAHQKLNEERGKILKSFFETGRAYAV